MKKIILLILLVLTGLAIQAQIPTGYYNNASNKTGDELLEALHDIIHNHTSISYNNIWNAFYSTDHRQDNVDQVWDIYSDIPGGTPPYLYELGSDQCGEYETEGECYNREHSWPQSWFGNQSTPRTDIHHIYPTDGKVNAERGNFPYGEVKKASWTSLNGSKVGTPKTELGYNGSTVFEPIDAYKGDIARGLFYMSVCYHNDDSDWGSSGMTNKSEILPWAMTMLLRWSDDDPVSQKEIDRNNAVYGIQGNRNPFIDHPEYAHMIWDDNWSGILYSITCATGLTHGSISAPESALEGNTVAITAIPDPGYMVDTYSVYKTGSPSTIVPVSDNGTFTMPAYAVTVSATFIQNTQQYTITKGSVSHGSISISATTSMSGSAITLGATPDDGYCLYAWHVFMTGNMDTPVIVNDNSFVMPAFDVTVMATFALGSNGDYEKVTSSLSDWSGEYLIVYEAGSKVFNGSLTALDAANNNISVTISNNKIATSTTMDTVNFTIAAITGGYSIKASSGKYIGYGSNSNGLSASDSPLVNTIAYSGGSIDIIGSGGAYLRYNNNTGNSDQRFRYYKSSSYTNQQAIQLYKKTASSATQPTHTIHFYQNGGSGSMNDQTVNEFEATVLQANAFTREGFVFDGWNTLANGTGTYYADGATVILTNDLALYAQWNPKYNITLVQSSNGTIAASAISAMEDESITLTATPNANYELDHWLVTDFSGNPIEVYDNQFDMPASNVTVTAIFVYVGLPYVQKYYLVTNANQLVAGRTYLIVNTTDGKALGTTQNSNNRSAAAITISNGEIESIGNNVCELTLGQSNGRWTFYDSHYVNNNITGGYLYAASSSNNYLRTQKTNDANGEWAISFNNGIATIQAQGSNTRNLLKYNSQSDIFSCYSSGQQDVQLFIRSENYQITKDTTLTKLLSFDYSTIHDGAVLTVTGTIACDQPNQMVIHEGGQLIHNVDGVQAIVKRNISSYSNNSDGWYTIAVPFTELTPSQLTSETYDLYAYDEAGDQEWMNYKANTPNFPTLPANGYLYAHTPDINLRLIGTLNSGSHTELVDLSYANASTILKGFNLLGNPTAHEITFTPTTNSVSVSDGYYYLENDDDWVYEPSNNVPMGRGFLVKANAEGQSVTLNPQSKRNNSEIQNPAFLKIDIDGEHAYVKTAEGVSMPLLSFKGHNSCVFLSRDGQPYIMLVRNGAHSLDLCFQAHRHGQHMLSVDTKGLEIPYLHLIDRITKSDIDLLQTPNYSFESSANDMTSRFRLLFSPDNLSDENDLFAYYSDGRIIIDEMESVNASLQIIDITGRLVENHNLASGVYVLRLITPEKVRIQKIVIN